METIQALELFEELKEKFGEGIAKKLIAYIDSRMSEKAATREDLINLREATREDLIRLRDEIFEKISQTEEKLRAEFREEIKGIKDEIKSIKDEIKEMRSFIFRVLVPVAALSSTLGAILVQILAKL